MNIYEARDLATQKFGILFPLTMEDFIKARAEIIRRNHSDKNSDADTDDFMYIMDILNTIKENFDIVNGFSSISSSTVTKTGESLSSLGKGLGDLINGRKCERCEGKGYEITKTPIFGIKDIECDCDHGYLHSGQCKCCIGTGKFVTKSGFTVKCKACAGTGVHVYKNLRPCPKCRNRRFSMFNHLFGYETIIGHKEELHKCYHCEGTGEIAIDNPVFQKGSMNIGVGKIEKVKVKTNTQQDYNSQLKRFNKIMNRK